MVDRVASHVAGVHVSSDVEVDGIPLTHKKIRCSTFNVNLPPNPESLSNTRQLSVADSCFHQTLVLVLGTDEKTFLHSIGSLKALYLMMMTAPISSLPSSSPNFPAKQV